MYQVRSETADGLQALREKIKTSGGSLWEEGIFREWGCVTPTHRSGRQTGVHQTFFLRSETLPASLEAMAKSAGDTTTHWRGCVDWTKMVEGEPGYGIDNYQCYLDTVGGSAG